MHRLRLPFLAMLVGIIALPGLAVVTTGADRVSAHSSAQPLDLPCAEGIGVIPVGQALPDEASGQVLVALRVEFAPGGSLDWHSHPGTIIVSVESGVFGFTMSEDEAGSESGDAMQITRAATDTTPASTEPVQPGTDYVLNPGDWLIEPRGMVHAARGLADEPTVVLGTGLVDQDQPLIACLDDASAS